MTGAFDTVIGPPPVSVVVPTVPTVAELAVLPTPVQYVRLPRTGVADVAMAAVRVPEVVIAVPLFTNPCPGVIDVTVPEFCVIHVVPIA